MLELFHNTSQDCSKQVTKNYSTSFYSAIQMLHKDLRMPICNIYGFVRLADEIVDTFHEHDKKHLLDKFKQDTYDAIENNISLNPILHAFQLTVNQYKIEHALIEAFFRSMEKDLEKNTYTEDEYREYIYGSAEVVGLMCLYVFCEGDKKSYESLKDEARSLGAAFQKVNFLRDIKADFNGLSRVYFPDCDFNNFSEDQKRCIEDDIANDFRQAYKGIIALPLKARFGVYVAYKYYLSLFKKIKRTGPAIVVNKRIRIPDYHKALIVFRAGIKNSLRLL